MTGCRMVAGGEVARGQDVAEARELQPAVGHRAPIDREIAPLNGGSRQIAGVYHGWGWPIRVAAEAPLPGK